jgi:hypothetical protein
MFGSGGLSSEMIKARELVQKQEKFPTRVNFQMENKDEVGLFFKCTEELNNVFEQQNLGVLYEPEVIKEQSKNVISACTSFAYFLKADE